MLGGKYSGPMYVWTSDLDANLSLLIASGPNHDFTIFHAAVADTNVLLLRRQNRKN